MNHPTIGSAVLCINDEFNPAIVPLYNRLPVLGKIYKIRDYRIAINPNGQGDVCLLLEGITNPLGEISHL